MPARSMGFRPNCILVQIDAQRRRRTRGIARVKLISWALSAARFSLYTCHQVRRSGKQSSRATYCYYGHISATCVWYTRAGIFFYLQFSTRTRRKSSIIIDAHAYNRHILMLVAITLSSRGRERERETASAFIRQSSCPTSPAIIPSHNQLIIM